MRICVTGGTGFTGAALVLRLLRDGHEVRVLDKAKGLMDEELRAAGALITYGSVTDEATVTRVIEGCEIVHHVAAVFREVGIPDSTYHDVNVLGTQVVTRAAAAAGVRKLVYCSTQGVHGHIADPPGSEDSPIVPEDYYQQTKYEGELAVREIAAAAGLEFTILRPTAIYGPGDPGRFLMIYRRVRKGWFPMFGRGRTFYHPLYIDNLVDAFVLAMGPGVGAGEAYIIADDEYLSIEELVRRVGHAMDIPVRVPHLPLWPLVIAGHACERVCKPLGIEPPIFPRRVDWFRQVRAFSIAKARRGLGYEPRVGLDEGLRRTADWYRATGRV